MTTREACPLLMDDVLVHSDRVRKRTLLDVIHAISRERQIILFTQEPEVVEWAAERVTDGVALHELAEPSEAQPGVNRRASLEAT